LIVSQATPSRSQTHGNRSAASRQNKTVEIILLDFISSIDTAGSPFAGPAAAPVIVTVFSDFE